MKGWRCALVRSPLNSSFIVVELRRPLIDYLWAQRRSQGNILGAWCGTFGTSGVVPIVVQTMAESALITAYVILPLSLYDMKHRPHFHEALAQPNAPFEHWAEGFIPAPQSVHDNRTRYPLPNVDIWGASTDMQYGEVGVSTTQENRKIHCESELSSLSEPEVRPQTTAGCTKR